MRLGILTLSALAMLAGCERAEPGGRPSAAEELIVAPPRPSVSGPDMSVPFKPVGPLPSDTEQARQQAAQSVRELDHRAATLGADIAGAREHAEGARLQAQPRSPAEPAPERNPKAPEPVAPAVSTSPSPTNPPPATPG